MVKTDKIDPKCDIPSHSPDARGRPKLRWWRESNGEAVSEFDCFVGNHMKRAIQIYLYLRAIKWSSDSEPGPRAITTRKQAAQTPWVGHASG